MATVFVVVFIVYIFQAYKRDFERKWDNVHVGMHREQVVEILGAPFKESLRNEKANRDGTLSTQREANLYSYWMVGVQASHVIGFDEMNAVLFKFPTDAEK